MGGLRHRAAQPPHQYDHDVPLELGGAVNDARNLWPEPDYAQALRLLPQPEGPAGEELELPGLRPQL